MSRAFQDFVGGIQVGVDVGARLKAAVEDANNKQVAKEEGEKAQAELDTIYGEIERLQQEPQLLSMEAIKAQSDPAKALELEQAAVLTMQANTLRISQLTTKANRRIAQSVTSNPGNPYLEKWAQGAFTAAQQPLADMTSAWQRLGETLDRKRTGRLQEAQIGEIEARTGSIKSEDAFRNRQLDLEGEKIGLDKRRVAVAEGELQQRKDEFEATGDARKAQTDYQIAETSRINKQLNEILPPEQLAQLQDNIRTQTDQRIRGMDEDDALALAEERGIDTSQPGWTEELIAELARTETFGAVKQLGDLQQLTADILKRKPGEDDELGPVRDLQRTLAEKFRKEGKNILTGAQIKRETGLSKEEAAKYEERTFAGGPLRQFKQKAASDRYAQVPYFTRDGRTNPEGSEAQPYKRGSFEEMLAQLLIEQGEKPVSADELLDRYDYLLRQLEDPDNISPENARVITAFIRSNKTRPPSAAREAFRALTRQLKSQDAQNAGTAE